MRKCRPSTGLPCLISTHPKGKVNCESDISSILRNFVGHPQNKILLSTKCLLLLYSHLVMSWKETSSNDFTAHTRLKCRLFSLLIFKNMFYVHVRASENSCGTCFRLSSFVWSKHISIVSFPSSSSSSTIPSLSTPPVSVPSAMTKYWEFKSRITGF